MLADLWPTFGLRITMPGLQLRLPDAEELAGLAALAGSGVHAPADKPFLTIWTDGTAQERGEAVLRGYWGQLSTWSVNEWRLGLGVFTATTGEPLGMVTLQAKDFPVVREVSTSSWLGLQHHGQGFGTQARLGLLTFAFDHLGAEAALTEVFQDNAASQGVSRKLGYESDGISRDARGAEVLVSDRLRLRRAGWNRLKHPRARVEGADSCAAMFRPRQDGAH